MVAVLCSCPFVLDDSVESGVIDKASGIDGRILLLDIAAQFITVAPKILLQYFVECVFLVF